MTTIADTGFAEMRLGKVVGVATAEGEACCCVVLDGVSEDRHLPIQIGQTEAFNLSATLTGGGVCPPDEPAVRRWLAACSWRTGPPGAD